MNHEAYEPADFMMALPHDGAADAGAAQDNIYQSWQHWPGAGDSEAAPGDARRGADPVRHGETLASLALIYLRHDNPSRAMVLALAAMTMGDISPRTLLAAAEAMLRAGDPAQALTVLGRFDGFDDAAPRLISRAPSQIEQAARHYIAAKALHRQGDVLAARDALSRSHALSQNMPQSQAAP